MGRDRRSLRELEEGARLDLDFGKIARVAGQCPDTIPVTVQDAESREVILIAYTNEMAFRESLKTRTATFWSTSRNELWIKGKTSGHSFELLEVYVNCEQNSLLYRVRPKAEHGICHTSNSQGVARNCYYRRLNLETEKLENTDP